jgi:WD40 repeat protein
MLSCGLGLDEVVRRAERARRKRVRNWGAALLLLTATFAGLAVFAEINRREAERQRNHAEQETIKAKENLSSALTALAFTEAEKRPVNAAKLALAAWPRGAAMDLLKRDVALNALPRSLAGLHERMRILAQDKVNSVAFSPDGARVPTGSEDKTARLCPSIGRASARNWVIR